MESMRLRWKIGGLLPVNRDFRVSAFVGSREFERGKVLPGMADGWLFLGALLKSCADTSALRARRPSGQPIWRLIT
jgi:hypothetical protein